MRLLLATRNRHKAAELRGLLGGVEVSVLTADEVPGLPEVDEDQPTLEGNARKKAQAACRASGLWALADDTGLEVEALAGAPGVLSARYAGPGCSYADNNAKLLSALAGLPPERRRAAFRTVVALAGPSAETVVEEGRLEGVIASRPAGENGFGYDPIFALPEKGRTLAQLSAEEKNALSHRSRALAKILPHIRKAASVLCALGVLCGSAVRSEAGRTEPGQETIWDRLMASQARRELRVGSRHLEEGRYDLAVREFERAAAVNPNDPASRMMAGVAHYWSGRVDLALEAYRQSLALDPKNAQAHMLVGIALAWKGDVPAAYAAFRKAADLDPLRPDIQMNLGSVEDALGRIPAALTHFRRAVALDDQQPLYHFQLGMLYRRLGRDAEAAESFHQALKLFPRFQDAWLELGVLEERRGEKRAAARDFRKAVDLKSRDSVARLRLGRLHLLMGQVKKAREVFAEAFHLTPEEEGGGLQLSVSYAGGKSPRGSPAKGGEGEAEPSKDEAAPESSDPLEVFARSLERLPLDQGALMQVDVVFVPKPKLVAAPREGGSSLKQALEKELSPREAPGPKAVRRDYRLRAAESGPRAEQIRGVLADLREVLAQAPPDADVRLGMSLSYAKLAEPSSGGGGGGAGGRGGPSEAKVSYQPRQVGNDLGLWVIGTGWMSLVEEVLPERGERPTHPDQSDWWVATGLAHAALGQGQQALSAFERACELDAGNASALLGRAVASVMTGREDAAVAALEKALEVDPKSRAARDGLKWLKRPSTRASQPAAGRADP